VEAGRRQRRSHHGWRWVVGGARHGAWDRVLQWGFAG
jgi:hypothetical protein